MVPVAAFSMGIFNLMAMKISMYVGIKLITAIAISTYSLTLVLMG